jgi:3-deoxy-D-manno-octulosonate 8-phosphate phosphatase KdsC-like HAD superfamily phosphatase
MLPQLRERTGGKIAYVGDDYYDIQIMSSVDVSFCPINSPTPVKRAATHILPIESGKGIIANIYDMFENFIPFSFPKDSADVNPK